MSGCGSRSNNSVFTMSILEAEDICCMPTHSINCQAVMSLIASKLLPKSCFNFGMTNNMISLLITFNRVNIDSQTTSLIHPFRLCNSNKRSTISRTLTLSFSILPERIKERYPNNLPNIRSLSSEPFIDPDIWFGREG